MVSVETPARVGGLAAYQRMLASRLGEREGVRGEFLCLREPRRIDRGEATLPWPVKFVGSIRWDRMHRWMTHLASRRLLHGMLERVTCAALPSQRISSEASGSDVLHFIGTGWEFLGFAVHAAAKRVGARFTILPAVHPLSWGDDAIDIRLYNMADRVLCLSEFEKRHLAGRGVSPEKLLRCGLPPMCPEDGDGRELRAALGIESRPTVLFLGRRDRGKGYRALLEAWSLVLRQIPDAVLLLAGPGQTHETLPSSLLPDSVRDLGVPDEAAKANALAACDVFCLPSAHESFGIVYLEAWSYGKPVICGTAPASRELVENGETGLWSDGSPEAIAVQIVALLRHDELRERLGAAGRAFQKREYTWEHSLAAHLAAFERDPNELSAARV